MKRMVPLFIGVALVSLGSGCMDNPHPRNEIQAQPAEKQRPADIPAVPETSKPGDKSQD